MTACTIDEFRAILEDVFDESIPPIGPRTTAADVPAWDSLNHVRLLLRLETMYGISFPTYEVEKVKNVGELLALIDRLKGA